MLQEAAVGSCNGGVSGYNSDSCNSNNIGSNTIVVCGSPHKQLCWKLGVSHNCVCIIFEGPLIYIVTCL